MVKYFLLSFIVICAHLDLKCQENEDLKPYIESRKNISLKGMKVLRTWGVLNLGTGIAGSIYTTGTDQYFHQMNAFWGGVNILISSVATRSIKRESYPSELSMLEMDQKKLERTFFFSAGLDVAYIGAGFGLLNWSKADNVQQERLEGYAYSFMLQGAFILALDATMYFLHKRNRKKRLESLYRKNYYMEQ